MGHRLSLHILRTEGPDAPAFIVNKCPLSILPYKTYIDGSDLAAVHLDVFCSDVVLSAMLQHQGADDIISHTADQPDLVAQPCYDRGFV